MEKIKGGFLIFLLAMSISFLFIDFSLALPTYTMPIQAIRLADDDGTRQADITPQQILQWVNRANQIYSAADIQFSFNPDPNGPDWITMNNTLLNSMAGDAHPNWMGQNGQLTTANSIAAQYPGKIVIFFREGPVTCPKDGCCQGCGFSWWTGLNFIVMPSFWSSVCGHQNLELLSHELGHYLGLAHTHNPTFACKENANEYFKGITLPCKFYPSSSQLTCADTISKIFDNDALITDPAHKVTDTDSDPFIGGDQNKCPTDFNNACDKLHTTVTLTSSVGYQMFSLPRENIMSYYDPHDALTQQQINIVRKTLEDRFQNILKPDLFITKGSKLSDGYSPFGEFETPDIWIDSEKNGLNVYPPTQKLDSDGIPIGPGDPPWVNELNHIGFRIRNIGTVEATNIKVNVFVKQKTTFTTKCGESDPIITDKLIGSVDIPILEPLQEFIGSVPWKPTKQGPVSITVKINSIPNEMSTSNNMAKETTYTAYMIKNKKGNYGSTNIKTSIINPCDFAIDIIAVPVNPNPVDPWELQLRPNKIITLRPGRERTVNIKLNPKESAKLGELKENTVALFQVNSIKTVEVAASRDSSRDVLSPETTELEMIGGITVLSQIVEDAEINCNVEPRQLYSDMLVTISGSIEPVHLKSPVALKFISPSGESYIRVINTDRNGNYENSFVPFEFGRWLVQAFWQGDEDHIQTESKICRFNVIRNRRQA